nr:hypothetical protein B0A51_16236 [Rachicladosporium sp. CCFEE 5018]
MKSFWKAANRSSRAEPYTEQTHPDLPLPRSRPPPIQRANTVTERQSASYPLENRRSIAILPTSPEGYANYTAPAYPSSPNEVAPSSPPLTAASFGVARSQTVLRPDSQAPAPSPAFTHNTPLQGSPSPVWSTTFGQLPAAGEHYRADQTSMIQSSGGKTSSDSGQNATLDRFTQRRLQRLNTEAGFREQRQGGPQVLSPPASDSSSSYNASNAGAYPATDAQPQPPLHQQPQPHPAAQQSAYGPARSNPVTHNAAQASQPQQPVTSASSRSPHYPPHEQPQVVHLQSQPQSQYSPPDSGSQYQGQDGAGRQQGQRSYSIPTDDSPPMASNNGGLPAPKAVRSGAGNLQSMHNGLTPREGQSQQGVSSSFNNVAAAANAQTQQYRNEQPQPPPPPQGDARRGTPQPAQMTSEDMSEEDVAQLVKDHKELRDKYTKVKKYYFEKEDQVKQLQNSLAHQRLSQSRTSLDDSEYMTRFNRLDGLIAQLAFSIRKSWRSIPPWLVTSVNKDAVATGKQEMTAAGRSFISCWLVEEVFDKCFHPDLEPGLSAQLRGIQKNIRRYAPNAQTSEEEEYLTAKVVNWRLSTLEGLQDALRAPNCAANRAQLTDLLKENLCSAPALHLQDPPPSDLEGGVHMIIELVVSIAIHLPLESRDVQIEYFMPGFSILPEQMKLESGIPPLLVSIADDAAERASMKSAASDITDLTNSEAHEGQGKKRSMLSALTGSGGAEGRKSKGKAQGAGGSSSSLQRPESSSGAKEEGPPRLRMAAGIGVSVRGRSVLVKAPVFGT